MIEFHIPRAEFISLRVVGSDTWECHAEWFYRWMYRNYYCDLRVSHLWWKDQTGYERVSEHAAIQMQLKATEINALFCINSDSVSIRFENDPDYLQAILSEG